MTRLLILVLILALPACTTPEDRSVRFIVAGDSMMAWNGNDQNVAAELQNMLREPVKNVSRSLAQLDGGFGYFNIPNQVEGYASRWIVLNGGANDLSRHCRCSACGPVLNRLVSPDGAMGAIPLLVEELRGQGSRVIWVDYYTAPRYAGTTCELTYKEFGLRVSRMADRLSGVIFIDLDETFRADDLSLFDQDRLHPSPKGSALIAEAVAELLKVD